jgi:hypothetical protein
MRLREECRCLQPPVLAFPHHPLVVLLCDLQVLQQHAFELVGAIRVLGHLPEPVQSQGHMSLPDRLAKRSRPSKISMRQLFDFAHAELLAGQRHHEVFDVLFADAVHAHELPQGVHVGVDREGAAKELGPDRRAHLRDEAQTHAYPRFAARKFFCHLGHTEAAGRVEFVDEGRLLQDAQGSVVGNPQKVHDCGNLVISQRGVRRAAKVQLARTAIPLETVEQDARFLEFHSFQGLLDAALGNRSQKPLFESRIFHAVALKTQIQTGKFNVLCHAVDSQGGFSWSHVTA